MTLLDATRPDARRPRGSARWVSAAVLDPLLVGLAALLVYAVHGFTSPLSHDLGVFVYGGEQFARGIPPYVGIFNSVGPLADAIPGTAIWLGERLGVDPVVSARVAYLVLSAVCCALISVLARDTFRSRTAALLAPTGFLLFECFTELAAGGPREKTAMLVFLVASLILIGRRRWLGAGVCAALATLTWQPVFLVTVSAVLVAALTTGEGRGRALGRFVLGGLVPTALTALYYAQQGAAQRAFDGFVWVNLRYTTQPSIFHDWVVAALWDGYHGSLVLVVAGLVAMLVLAGRAAPYAVLTGGQEPTVAWRLTTMGAGCLAGVVWTACVINGAPDLFVVLPFAALGLGGALTILVARLSSRTVVPAIAVLLIAGVVGAGSDSRLSRKDGLMVQRAEARQVLATQPRSATILSIDAPQPLALTNRQSLWPYQLFDDRMTRYLDATQPGGTAALATRLSHERPTFVVVGSHTESTWQETVLAQDYQRVGAAPGWVWYMRKDAGRAALARAHDANRLVMGSTTAE